MPVVSPPTSISELGTGRSKGKQGTQPEAGVTLVAAAGKLAKLKAGYWRLGLDG